MSKGITVTELRNEIGELHCDNGPAVFDEKKEYVKYYKNGMLHRLDGPAVVKPEYIGGCYEEEWYVNGKLHRDEDKPAFIHGARYMTNENEALYRIKDDFEYVWYKNGKQHRIGGPARITNYVYGIKDGDPRNLTHEWCENDKPSTNTPNGYNRYIVDSDGSIYGEENMEDVIDEENSSYFPYYIWTRAKRIYNNLMNRNVLCRF